MRTEDDQPVIFGAQFRRDGAGETVARAVDLNCTLSHAAKINVLSSKY